MQGDNGKALGTLQLHNHWRVDRTDPIASAYAYLGAVWTSHDFWMPRKCPSVTGDDRRFLVAQMRVNRGPIWRSANAGEQRCHGRLPASISKLFDWLSCENSSLGHPRLDCAIRLVPRDI